MTRPRRARLTLPPLCGEEAFLLAKALELLATAIWRAHGDAMADFQGRAFPDLPPDPDAVVFRDNRSDDDIDDIDF
jgi:hypothetical protein